MLEARPNPELLRALGRLARGLAGLFWGLPLALVVCVQTARGDWLRPLTIFPALLVCGYLVYSLGLMGDFQPQERVWQLALARARAIAILNFGLSPFLYWWSRVPSQPYFDAVLWLLTWGGILFLFFLNPLLRRLSAMLPDEALRAETRLFTTINQALLGFILAVSLAYSIALHAHALPAWIAAWLGRVEHSDIWFLLFFILLPFAMTMALLWKMKEVILAGVFGGDL